jgi:SAM-dependent methyltransferase
MPLNALELPPSDPAPLFEHFRGAYATEMLAAGVAHFDVFGTVAREALGFDALRKRLKLARRPANVLLTGLRSMGLLALDGAQRFVLTPQARAFLAPEAAFSVGGYVSLMAESPGVLEFVERLRSGRPAGAEKDEAGAAFIYKEGVESAMERESSARALTLALAGRAKNCAPALAHGVDLSAARVLLDIGGGTGIYSIAALQKNPQLRAIVWDRPEVLKIAGEFAAAYGVAERIELRAGDMFGNPVPADADTILLSNVLHDWDEPDCANLVRRCAAALPPGGRLLIHDVLLDDDLGGPLPIALYSAALFCLTEGRAYSAAEYNAWLRAAGLTPGPRIPTRVHCSVLTATK